jgi:hypothetical protein
MGIFDGLYGRVGKRTGVEVIYTLMPAGRKYLIENDLLK